MEAAGAPSASIRGGSSTGAARGSAEGLVRPPGGQAGPWSGPSRAALQPALGAPYTCCAMTRGATEAKYLPHHELVYRAVHRGEPQGQSNYGAMDTPLPALKKANPPQR